MGTPLLLQGEQMPAALGELPRPLQPGALIKPAVAGGRLGDLIS